MFNVTVCEDNSIELSFQDHKGPVSCAKFNHNASAIASGSETGEIIVYNVVTGQGCRPLVTPQPQVFTTHGVHSDFSHWQPKSVLIEPRHEKTCLWGFRPGKTQTGLRSHRS